MVKVMYTNKPHQGKIFIRDNVYLKRPKNKKCPPITERLFSQDSCNLPIDMIVAETKRCWLLYFKRVQPHLALAALSPPGQS